MAKMLSFKINEEDFLVTHSKNHRCKTIRIVHDLSGSYGENVVSLFQENDKQLALEALVYSNIFQ